MTPTRWLIVVFWLFIAGMLYREFHQSEVDRKVRIAEHPQQEHFFFTPLPGHATPPPASVSPAGGVQQTSFQVQPNTPGPGNFTCLVTVKNVGSVKAENVQVHVLPYKGGYTGDSDIPDRTFGPITDTSSLGQYGDWVAFPDLAPGESETRSAVFIDHPNANPGTNPKPEIIFETPKAQP
jgi:hypothetical protein